MDKDVCIREMYRLLEDLETRIRRKDLSMFRGGGAGGQDQYAGMSGFERAWEGMKDGYKEEIEDAWRNKK